MVNERKHPPGSLLNILYLPLSFNEWDVTRALAAVLHTNQFDPKFKDDDERTRLNFKVTINHDEQTQERKVLLILPTEDAGRKVKAWFREHPLKLGKNKIRFTLRGSPPRDYEALTLQRTPFLDPDNEEAHQKKIFDLSDELRVDEVQFGVFYWPSYPSNANQPSNTGRSRAFSVEWSKDYAKQSAAWLHFEYDHKLIRITLGDKMTEAIGRNIAISFSSIIKIGVGYDMGRPYVCFDTRTPPILERIDFHRTLTGDNEIDNKKYKQRLTALPGQERVAPFAHKLRLLLHKPLSGNATDIIQQFCELCDTAGIASSTILGRSRNINIEASRQDFFSERTIFKLQKSIECFEWPIAFQLELLLYNGLLLPRDIMQLLPSISTLSKDFGPTFVGDLLRTYAMEWSHPKRSSDLSPMRCFENVRDSNKRNMDRRGPKKRSDDKGMMECYHVTFTPTRVVLEGPYPTQSNRVLRLYHEYSDHFIRVDFRDDDRLNYRWDRAVDIASFLQEHVGVILKNGFTLAGRSFEFLAYSSSALREHTVWFMTPFTDKHGEKIVSEVIRRSLGDFAGTTATSQYKDEEGKRPKVSLMHFPSKFAARLAQSFTATDPSVKIRRDEWEEVPDLGLEPYIFTDGVGTISQSLADRIWKVLCNARPNRIKNSIQPSAYQIRFLGFKGVVSVDKHMEQDNPKIHMRLRPSMKKHEDRNVAEAAIEIAKAFERPNTTNLNKALVVILEGQGIKTDAFMDLQQLAIAEAHSIHDSIDRFREVLQVHSLGYSSGYRLPFLLKKLQQVGLDLDPQRPCAETPFLRQLRQVAMTEALREIKHEARIYIPNSYKLVGVADEGPAYRENGYSNVYVLEPGFIYACIQYPDKEPTWLEGNCTISRSPVVHPGDVQRVRAIGKPPEGMLCTFAHLKNVVVFPSVGKRSMPSCLGGGDLDGDEYDIILNESLLPPYNVEPMPYVPGKSWELERPCNISDICDFVVEYIHSDVLGLLSDRLLVIADQSLDGIFDPDCAKLARMCSQAVDYPKQGIRVDIDGKDGLPRTLIRQKPDWHAAEIIKPRQTDYYTSTRALGHLFRAITIEDPDDIMKELAERQASLQRRSALNDPISVVLADRLNKYINTVTMDASALMGSIFKYYADELRYICMTHSISNTPGVMLLEAEIVIGCILAKCTQRRWRKERAWRMRTHASELVHNVQQEISPMENLVVGLERAWCAWDYSLHHQTQFGANSFGLIALGLIFEILEKLESPE